MGGWYQRLSGHEFEQTPGDSEGQGSLACCSPLGHKELEMIEQLNSKICCNFVLLFYKCFTKISLKLFVK